MKRRLFYLALSFIMLFSVSLALSSCSEANAINLENKSEEELMEIIDEKSAEEIVEDIKNSDFSLESSVSMVYAIKLNEKYDELDPDTLIKEIKNKRNSDIARIIFIQVCDSNNVNLTEDKDIIKIIENSRTPFEVKVNLLINYSKYSKDFSLLETLAEGDDDELAFQALKFLNMEDPKSANVIADRALANYKSIPEDILGISLSVKGLYFKTMNPNNPQKESIEIDNEELLKFIDICDYAIKAYPDHKESIAHGSAIFALSDALNEKTITYIIDSPLIEDSLKAFCIEQNMIVLRDMIEENPTEENIDTVLKAMEISPLKDLEEPLATYLESNPDKKEIIIPIINKIEEEGSIAVGGRKQFE